MIEDLLRKYQALIEEKLSILLQKYPNRQDQLEPLRLFLQENEQFIQGTCLDYFAQPEGPVTKALVKIATELAPDLNTSPFQLLLPSASWEGEFKPGISLIEADLTEILFIHHVSSNRYLIPVRQLMDYIYNPEGVHYSPYSKNNQYYQIQASDWNGLFQHSETTLRLQEIFRRYWQFQSGDQTLCSELKNLTQQLLMNDADAGKGQEEDAGKEAYDPLTTFFHYYTSLETCYGQSIQHLPEMSDLPDSYFLGYMEYNGQLYFLNRYSNTITVITSLEQPIRYPIFLIQCLNLEDIPIQVSHPSIFLYQEMFYIRNKKGELIQLQETEGVLSLYPFFSHSNEPFDLAYISEEVYAQLAQQGMTEGLLSSQLHLYFTHSGSLSLDTLMKIKHQTGHYFIEGYTHVPEPIKKEIELLFALSYNPCLNKKTKKIDGKCIIEYNLDTCIATRGHHLRRHLADADHQNQLLQIGLNEIEKKKKIKELSDELALRREILIQDSFKGQDRHLKLNVHVIKRLQYSFVVTDIQSFYIFNDMDPHDLKIVIQENSLLKKSVVDYLMLPKNHSAFLVYGIETSIQTLDALFSIYAQERVMKEALFSHLDWFSEEKIQLILRFYLTSKLDFKKLLADYMDQDHVYLLLKPYVFSFIQTVDDFKTIFQLIHQKNVRLLYPFMEEIFPKIIHTVEDCRTVYQVFAPDIYAKEAYPLLKNSLFNVLKNTEYVNHYERVIEMVPFESSHAFSVDVCKRMVEVHILILKKDLEQKKSEHLTQKKLDILTEVLNFQSLSKIVDYLEQHVGILSQRRYFFYFELAKIVLSLGLIWVYRVLCDPQTQSMKNLSFFKRLREEEAAHGAFTMRSNAIFLALISHKEYGEEVPPTPFP